ncbi:MAG: hypothetical protein H7Z12_10415 [Rhodospirillaceae bacterium]|nr:hypothetical protein [Rhodospirillales bacterium]
MSRIGTYGASQMYLSRLSAIQQRMSLEQIQITTEKKSTNYTGIAPDSNRLINMENEKARAQQFIKDNTLASTRMQAATVSMDGMEKNMKDFKKRLEDYASTGSRNQQDIEQLQEWAFNSMVDLQSYLAASVDGQYIFSGGRVATDPVNLPANSHSAFQAIYDGNDHPYPTTRSAHMAEISTTNADTGNLTFSTAGTITAATAGSLSGIAVGSRVTVAGAAAANNQTYTVVGNTGTVLDVSRFTTEPAAAAVTFRWNDNNNSLTNAATGNLSISPGADTITATNAGSLAGLAVGTVFSISGSAAGNDGVYQVKANTGTVLTIESTTVGANEAVAATLSSSSWYDGDTLQIQQRIDTDRSVDLGVYASDPAFEKAFRAMGLIAQGVFGTAGGLENNMARIDQARFLIQDALSRNGTGVGPFGAEQAGDLESLQSQVGTTAKLILEKNNKHASFSGFLDVRIVDLENVDKTEAITRLMDDKTALEASYQTLSNVRSLSLLNYLK